MAGNTANHNNIQTLSWPEYLKEIAKRSRAGFAAVHSELKQRYRGLSDTMNRRYTMPKQSSKPRKQASKDSENKSSAKDNKQDSGETFVSYLLELETENSEDSDLLPCPDTFKSNTFPVTRVTVEDNKAKKGTENRINQDKIWDEKTKISAKESLLGECDASKSQSSDKSNYAVPYCNCPMPQTQRLIMHGGDGTPCYFIENDHIYEIPNILSSTTIKKSCGASNENALVDVSNESLIKTETGDSQPSTETVTGANKQRTETVDSQLMTQTETRSSQLRTETEAKRNQPRAETEAGDPQLRPQVSKFRNTSEVYYSSTFSINYSLIDGNQHAHYENVELPSKVEPEIYVQNPATILPSFETNETSVTNNEDDDGEYTDPSEDWFSDSDNEYVWPDQGEPVENREHSADGDDDQGPANHVESFSIKSAAIAPIIPQTGARTAAIRPVPRPFLMYTVEEVITCFEECALPQLAIICKEENLDGEYFKDLSDEDLYQEPFCLNQFHVSKLRKIMTGWRPKRLPTFH